MFKIDRYFFTFIVSVLILAILSVYYLYGIRCASGNPIRSDGWGYYSYLPAIFDYCDFTFSFSDDPSKPGAIRLTEIGRYLNKYPIGTAILEFPFFITTDLVLKLFHKSVADGYSVPYQLSIIISTFFYFSLGLFILYKILLKYFSLKICFLTLITITFCTNLFHYATFDACFSHIYSFFIITLFVYIILCYKESNTKDFLIGLILGLITVIRNVDILIILFLFVYKAIQFRCIKDTFKYFINPKRILYICLGGGIPILPQIVYWYYSTGDFIIRSYSTRETFSWLSPHIPNILFSIKKGMLFYSPILFFSFVGLIFLKLKKNNLFLPIIIVIFTHLYVTSSWDQWQYGGSFGQRPFINFYCLYAICIGAFLSQLIQISFNFNILKLHLKFNLLNVFCLFICCLIYLNVRLMLAYWHGILPFADSTIYDVLRSLGVS